MSPSRYQRLRRLKLVRIELRRATVDVATVMKLRRSPSLPELHISDHQLSGC